MHADACMALAERRAAGARDHATSSSGCGSLLGPDSSNCRNGSSNSAVLVIVVIVAVVVSIAIIVNLARSSKTRLGHGA